MILVALTDLGLGDRVTAALDAACHSRHSHVLWKHQYVEGDEVTRCLSLIDERKLGRAREDCLGDELFAALDERGSRRLCNLGRLIGMTLGVVWPTLARNHIGIDEQGARLLFGKYVRDERRLPSSIRSGDEIEAAHSCGSARRVSSGRDAPTGSTSGSCDPSVGALSW